jgi:hypothetical protein
VFKPPPLDAPDALVFRLLELLVPPERELVEDEKELWPELLLREELLLDCAHVSPPQTIRQRPTTPCIMTSLNLKPLKTEFVQSIRNPPQQ